jgi:hypothetical protein
VRALFYRPEDPGATVGEAAWTGRGVDLRADDPGVRQALGRIFRPTPVAVDEPAWRSFGASGPVLLQPGTLSWFTGAARARAPAEGLAVRFVPSGGAGWDPAGAYRPFLAAVERRERAAL